MGKKKDVKLEGEETPKAKKRKKTKTKPDKLFNNLFKVTLQYVQGKSYTPSSSQELMEKLRLLESHSDIFNEILEQLIEKKIITFSNGKYLNKPTDKIIVGTLKIHPRGFGFLQTEDSSYDEEVFIPKQFTHNAVDGDLVEVIVNPIVSEKGPEGKVVTILKRGRTHLAGIIRTVEPWAEIVAYAPLLGNSKKVLVQNSEIVDLKVGDRVVMEVLEWGDKDSDTRCRVSHYIGHISDPSVDVKAAIEEFELRSDFSQHTIEEALEMGTKVPLSEIKNREDLRTLECFTIDPDTAKDFDDAVSLYKDDKGYHLGVHIADVSFYVRPGSALDKEAFDRCNSTYFPGTVVPMLPSVLSDNLCSLKPKVNRLTVSIFVDFDLQGNQVDYRITRSVIKSAKRFTYKEAKAVLDGKKQSKFKSSLELMVELCGHLKRKRYERGSIEFSLPELVVIVDEKGVPQKTDYIEYDITHQLIEEFMLKANEVVATHLSTHGKELTYRVHDVPAEENLKDFSTLALAFGFDLSPIPTPAELQTLFDEALHTPYGEYLATSYIRRMRLAIYSPDNIGHYGLGLTHYCHFTSPIRRYVDLVVHRILFEKESDRGTLEVIANKCSEQERTSAKAEMSVVTLKKLRLLDSYHKADPNRQYDAIITRVKPFGMSFEIIDFLLEGFLHISEIEDDFYIFEEANNILRGRRNGAIYRPGDKITVILKKVNFILQESEWHFVAKIESEVDLNRKKIHNNKKKHKKEQRNTDRSHNKKSFKGFKSKKRKR